MSGLPVDPEAIQVLPHYRNRTGPNCENIDGNASMMNTHPFGPKWTYKVICPILDRDDFLFNRER